MWERSFVVYYNVGKIFVVLLLKKLIFVYLLACHYLFCENMSFLHSLYNGHLQQVSSTLVAA